MKKTIIITTLVLLALVKTNAQSSVGMADNREKLFFGLKIGGNYSNVYDTKGDDFVADPTFGLAGGVFVSIPIGRYLGIQPELLYSQKGYKSSGTFFGETYSMTRTTDYLDIPLMVAIKPIEYITILVGPQYSYLLKQKDNFTGGSISSSNEQIFSNDNYRKNTLCFIGGADINIDHLVVGARAGWDVTTNNGDGSSATPRYKNMWYQVTLGYRF